MQRVRKGPLGRTVLALQVAAVVVLMSCLLLWGYLRLMNSDRLKVAQVEVRGAHFLSEGEVRALLGPAVGENVLALDINALKERLRLSPWVEAATVRRTLPDTLQVQIEERQPVALAEIDRLWLMDGEGVLIEVYGERTAGFDLPIVRSLAGLGIEERARRARRVGALLTDLGEWAGELSEVRVDPDGDLEAVLRGGEVVRLGGPPFRKRFVAFLGLRGPLKERCPEAEWFDLRFRNRIYAQERPSVVLPSAAEGR